MSNRHMSRNLKVVIETFDAISATVKAQADKSQALTDEKAILYTRCHLTDGRVTTLEKVVEHLRVELLQINARSMRNNIIFQNISQTET